MIKSFLTASAIIGSMTASSIAGGLEGSYAGAGVAIDVDGSATAASISGRYDVPKAPISFRPQFTIGEQFGGNLALTADIAVAENLNFYAGGGAGFGAGTALNGIDDTVGFAVLGAEGAVAKDVVVFGDVKFGLGGKTTYVPTIGVAYKF